jgi:hypothetical protein
LERRKARLQNLLDPAALSEMRKKAAMGVAGLDRGMAILTKPFAMGGLATHIRELLIR